MDVLRGHFRPEFLNRIDEIIVFHALGKEEIRHIVGLQLDRVARSAASQGVTLTLDQTLIDHFRGRRLQAQSSVRVNSSA